MAYAQAITASRQFVLDKTGLADEQIELQSVEDRGSFLFLVFITRNASSFHNKVFVFYDPASMTASYSRPSLD